MDVVVCAVCSEAASNPDQELQQMCLCGLMRGHPTCLNLERLGGRAGATCKLCHHRLPQRTLSSISLARTGSTQSMLQVCDAAATALSACTEDEDETSTFDMPAYEADSDGSVGAADTAAPQTPLATTTICTKFSTYAPFNLAAPAPTPAGTLKPKTLSFATEAHDTNSFDQIVGKNDAMSVPDAPRPSVYAQGWPAGLRPLLSRGLDNIQELPVQHVGSSMAGHTHPLSPSSSASGSPRSPVLLAAELGRMYKRPRMETRFKRQLSAVNLAAAENNAA